MNPLMINELNSNNNNPMFMNPMLMYQMMNNMLGMNDMNSFNPMNNRNNFKLINDINSMNIASFMNPMHRSIVNNNPTYDLSIIKTENDIITNDIKQTVYEYLDGGKGEYGILWAGEFLYSIGGIARKSLELSFRIFYEFYQEYYKGYQENNNMKEFFVWAKKELEDKGIKNYSKKYLKKITKYSNPIIDFNFDKLQYYFESFLKLYLKCKFCIPSVEVNFELEDNNFNSQIMDDIIFKGKPSKVNFCYLPQLKSNETIIDGANFHVFTYIEGKSYKKANIDY